MSNRAPKRTRGVKTEPKNQNKRQRKGLFRAVLAVILAIATLLGYAILIPRVTVSASDPIDPRNPFSSKFTITNESYYPLTDVSVGFGLGELHAASGGTLHGGEPLSENAPFFTDTRWQHHRLAISEQFSISPYFSFRSNGSSDSSQVPGNSGDIAVIVKYKMWFLPWIQVKAFRFQMLQATNGTYLWYSIPLQ